MTLEEDYKLARRIDELLCTEYDKRNPDVRKAAFGEGINIRATRFIGAAFGDFVEHYCLTMAEKKALRELGRFEELKRIYGEDE